MSNTDNFEEFLSLTLPYKDLDYSEDRVRTKEILEQLPMQTFSQRETEYIAKTASIPVVDARSTRNEYFKQWNGRVVRIESEETFIAIVKPVIAHEEMPKIVRFNNRKVTIVNRDLMSEGAPFYWTVGMFRNQKNTLVKRSEVRFKMMGHPSETLLASIEKDLGQLFDGISWLE